LILADLQTLENALPRLEKENRIKRGDPVLFAAAQKAKEILEAGKLLSAGADAAGLDLEEIRSLQLMTAKRYIYVFNMDDEGLNSESLKEQMRSLVEPSEAIFLDAQLEAELAELDEEDAAELLAESGQEEPGLETLARVGFETLGLQTYLTAGPKEARAWTIYKGDLAPEAAGVIHTDFQRGFIKAEVVSFAELDDAGSMAEAKARGRVRMEGKDYVMQDGDVVEFRSGLTSGGKR